MKKQILVGAALVAVLAAGSAQAQDRKTYPHRRTSPSYEQPAAAQSGHNMAGCGLGSMVVQDKGKWAQVGAAFLNGTGMQTFGISFGTSNCTEDGVASAAREKDAFVEANLADIRRDLAVGEGEYLSSLASFYGCKGEKSAQFNRALRKHQAEVVDTSAEEASRVIDSAVSQENAACQRT